MLDLIILDRIRSRWLLFNLDGPPVPLPEDYLDKTCFSAVLLSEDLRGYLAMLLNNYSLLCSYTISRSSIASSGSFSIKN
jgi:hypothetical protein